MNNMKMSENVRIASVCAWVNLICFGVVVGSPAAMAANYPLGGAAQPPASDLAHSWLEALFLGKGLPQTGALAALAEALHDALGAYGMAMLVVAGFLLMWQIVSMIAETAQTGVPMGRRTNQLWAPMRFLLGIALLIPFGGGLCVGQYAIVKIAEQGSSLASTAWQEAMNAVGDRFLAPLIPRSPDVGRFVSAGFEMEVCRSLYQQLYQVTPNNPVLLQAGPMTAFHKNAARNLSDETWLYTNSFFPNVGLCGGYLFLSPYVSTDDVSPGQAMAEAERAFVERFAMKSRPAAEALATAFLFPNPVNVVTQDPSKIIDGLAKEQSQIVGEMIEQAKKSARIGNHNTLAAKAEQGWVVAGTFLWDMARQQVALGEVAARVLPRVKTPLLGHDILTREDWMRKAQDDPAVRATLAPGYEPYRNMYDRLSASMRQVRAWLYDQRPNNANLSLPDQQDVRDAFNSYADAETAASILSRMMSVGAASFGVFARSSAEGEQNNSDALLANGAFVEQPLQTMAEMGRRFMGYGAWALGMLGPALSQPASMALAVLFALLSVAFWLGGVVLLFLVPFVPLFRLLAAVLTWGVSVLAAVVSLPVVALAHLYPAGEGLVGPVARGAYWLWLSLFLRPILILFGFAGGLLLFFFGAIFFNALVLEWLAPMATLHSDALWLVRAALALVYAVGLYGIANVSFRGISYLPERVMDWIDGISLLPESTVIAQPGVAGQVVTMPGGGAVYVGGTTGTSTALGLNVKASGAAHKDKERSVSPASKQRGHAVHFPEMPEKNFETPLSSRAEAWAFAAAQDSSGAQVQAGAAAGSESGAGKIAAMAKTTPAGGSQKELLMPDEVRLRLAEQKRREKEQKEIEEAKEKAQADQSKESPEQTGAPVDPFERDKP